VQCSAGTRWGTHCPTHALLVTLKLLEEVLWTLAVTWPGTVKFAAEEAVTSATNTAATQDSRMAAQPAGSGPPSAVAPAG